MLFREYNKKGAVLEAAVNYIKRLQSEQKQMEEYRQQQEMLQRANRTLLLEIQVTFLLIIVGGFP